jgi:hypothetical protein
VGDCIEMCSGPSVYVREKGVEATFRNSDERQVRKVHFDSCFNTAEGIYKADYIVGLKDEIDIVVELKGSHTNLPHAYRQVVDTLESWGRSPNRYPRMAALIVYGAIFTRDNLPRRKPKARSSVQAVEGDFRKQFQGRIRLLVYESGEKQFTFGEFLRKNDAI